VSWIRNHTRHYIVPALKAYAKAIREAPIPVPGYLETLREPDLSLIDVKHPPVNMRPARGCKYKEYGLVLAACKCFGVPLSSLQEKMLHIGLHRRVFGYRVGQLGMPQDEIHNTIKNSCKSLKRILMKDPRRKLILPGRDVWLWSVQCHRMGIPHVFDPRVSRGVARHDTVLRDIVSGWNINKHSIIFDTGFAGSIYNRIVKVSGIKCTNLMFSTMRKNPRTKLPEQLWPYHRGARGKALTIEYLPKYQKTGTTRSDQPIQYMAELDEFINAAILTIWFWHHESPAWIAHGEHRCKVIDCSCRSCQLWKEGIHAVSNGNLNI